MTTPPYRSPEHPPAPTRDVEALLGAPRSTHRPPPLWRALVPAIVSAVLLVAACEWFTRLAHPLPVALFALVPALAVFALTAVEPLRMRGVHVEMFAEGLVVDRRGVRDALLFDDVDTVWFVLAMASSPLGSITRVTALRLVDHEGVAHVVPLQLAELDRIANPILQRCSNVHLPAARAALRDGETLRFGDVNLDAEGVTIGGARATWAEISLVRFQPGRVCFFRRAPLVPWRAVSLEAVPHPLLFSTLVTACAANTEVDDPLVKTFGG